MSVSLDLNVEINGHKNDTTEVDLKPLGILSELDIPTMNRDKLKKWCGIHGIRRNIKTEEMKFALYSILKQEPVDAEMYTKKNRIILTKKKKVSGIVAILFIIGIIMFFSFKGGDSMTHIAQNITNSTYSPF